MQPTKMHCGGWRAREREILSVLSELVQSGPTAFVLLTIGSSLSMLGVVQRSEDTLAFLTVMREEDLFELDVAVFVSKLLVGTLDV